MFNRLNSPWLVLGGSAVVVAALAALLLWREAPDERPLVLYCAPALKEPLDEIVALYEEQTGQKVVVTYGPSQTILAQLKLAKQADLFFPADDSYVRMAEGDNLIAESHRVATMHAVVVVNPMYPKKVSSFNDLLVGDLRVAQANPDASAIGQLTRSALPSGKWSALKERTIEVGSVTEVPNGVRIGNRIQAGIVWDAMLEQPSCQELKPVSLPELDAVVANVKIAVSSRSSRKKEANDFAVFVANSCKDIWARHGYHAAEGEPSPEPGKHANEAPDPKDVEAERPEIVLYAGAMLRPAVEATIEEFEKREGVKVVRVYNGCGILVSQMKAGKKPDVYFACDTSFMTQVETLFDKPKVVSKNRLVIAVPKGNPKGVKSLADLGKQGLRVGVGHEQQCALGVITRGAFIRSKVYKAVMENVKVQSPTGDMLINQLRTGALDAVVAYVSNVRPYDDLAAVPIDEVNCSPAQPVAVSRSTAHPDVTKRLVQALESAPSRERFEKLGFGWEIKP